MQTNHVRFDLCSICNLSKWCWIQKDDGGQWTKGVNYCAACLKNIANDIDYEESKNKPIQTGIVSFSTNPDFIP